MEVFESSSKVDYYKGEENPARKWPKKFIQKKRKTAKSVQSRD
jgi:hypothetical protein